MTNLDDQLYTEETQLLGKKNYKKINNAFLRLENATSIST